MGIGDSHVTLGVLPKVGRRYPYLWVDTHISKLFEVMPGAFPTVTKGLFNKGILKPPKECNHPGDYWDGDHKKL